MPKLVDRRGALVDPMTESNSSKRRNSYDSESYTYSVRRVSEESRRHSLDSQISLQISEVTATHKTKNPRTSHRSGRTRGKRRRKEFSRTRKHSQSGTRRGSSTSQESQIDIKVLLMLCILPSSSDAADYLQNNFFFQILTALAFNNSNILPNLLKRRLGNAGLDASDFTEKKFCFPNIEISDEEPFQEPNVIGFSDDDVSNGSEELCSPGEGIQALDQGDSDSEADHNLSMYHNDSEDDENTEIDKIERILRREKAFTARESYRNKFQIRDLEYEKKSYEQDRKYKFRSDYYSNRHIRHTRPRAGEKSRQKIWDDVRRSSQRLSRHQTKGSKIDERLSRKNKYNYKTERRRKSSVSDVNESLELTTGLLTSDNVKMYKAWQSQNYSPCGGENFFPSRRSARKEIEHESLNKISRRWAGRAQSA